MNLDLLSFAKDPLPFIKNYRYGFNSQKQKPEFLPLLDFEKEIINTIHENKTSIFIKSRQMHLDSLVQSYVLWYSLMNSGKNILYISPNMDSSIRFIFTLKENFFKIADNFSINITLTTNSKKCLQFSNGTRIQACAATENAGKGDSIDMLIFSEAEYIKDFLAIWMASLAALTCNGNSKLIAYTSPNIKQNDFSTFIKRIKPDSDIELLKIPWNKNPYYDHLWYEREKEKLGDESLAKFYLDLEAIQEIRKEKKDRIITLRISKEMELEIYRKMEERKVGTFNISDYLRKLIESDLKK